MPEGIARRDSEVHCAAAQIMSRLVAIMPRWQRRAACHRGSGLANAVAREVWQSVRLLQKLPCFVQEAGAAVSKAIGTGEMVNVL